MSEMEHVHYLHLKWMNEKITHTFCFEKLNKLWKELKNALQMKILGKNDE